MVPHLLRGIGEDIGRGDDRKWRIWIRAGEWAGEGIAPLDDLPVEIPHLSRRADIPVELGVVRFQFFIGDGPIPDRIAERQLRFAVALDVVTAIVEVRGMEAE